MKQFTLNLFLKFIVFQILVNSIFTCGMLTHTEISHRGFHQFKPSSWKKIDYKQYIIENPSYFMAGSPFPDWGYACKFPSTAEDTHWPPFIHAYVNHLNSKYPSDSERRAQLISFLFGIESHGISDVVWHWGDEVPGSDEQGYLHSMGHMASDCKDEWTDCHTPGDAGGDFYLAYRGGLRWLSDYWTVPVPDLDSIYKEMGSPTNTKVMTECLMMLYTGARLESLVSVLVLPQYEKKAAFLTEDLDLWFHGGLDDMANHATWQWQNVINLIEEKNLLYEDSLKRREKLKYSKNIDMTRIVSKLLESEYYTSGKISSLFGMEKVLKENGDIEIRHNTNLLKQNEYELFKIVGLTLFPVSFGKNYNSIINYYNFSPIIKNYQGNNYNKPVESKDSNTNLKEKSPPIVQEFLKEKEIKNNLNFLDYNSINSTENINTAENYNLNFYDVFTSKQLLQIHKNKISGKTSFSYFGKSVTYGDFDGDGLEEMVVGAPGFGDFQRGGVYILEKNYTNSSNLKESFEYIINKLDEPILLGEEPYSRFGFSLATVDMNHDGIDDLVVSAPTFGKNGPSQSIEDYYIKDYHGKIYVYLGVKGQGIMKNAKPDLLIVDELPQRHANHTTNNTNEFSNKFFNLGFFLNSKDCNGDGYNDLLIGSPYSGQGGDKIGHVAAFYNPINPTNETNIIKIENAPFQMGGQSDYQEFGYSIDCHAGLILVGAPGSRFTSSKDYQASGEVIAYDLLTKQKNFTITSDKPQARFGASLDINSQNNLLAVGAPSFTVQEAFFDYHNGVVFLYSLDSLKTGNDYNNFKLKIHSHATRSRFGKSVKFVKDNLIIAAPKFSYNTDLIEAGKLFIYKNIQDKTGELTSDVADSVVEFSNPGSRLGDFITINKDESEIAISAPYTLADEFCGSLILI